MRKASLAAVALVGVLVGCGGKVARVIDEPDPPTPETPETPDDLGGGQTQPGYPGSSSGSSGRPDIPGYPGDPSDATYPVGAFPATVPTACGASVVDVLDCAGSSGYRVSTYRPQLAGDPELHVVGVYETRSDHSAGNHPRGEGKVHVSRRTRQVLALTSYEPTDWSVTVDQGVVLEKVVLMGYHLHTVKVPAGVPVVDLSGPGRSPACAVVWPGDDQGCNTQGTVGRAEHAAQAPIASFAGCYRATSFVVRDDTEICP